MPYPIKQSTTAQKLMFFMVDSADHITAKTGLSPTVTLSKNGAAFGAPAGAVSELSAGWYLVAGNATDSNTLGPLALHATSAGADPTDTVYHVVAYDPQTAYAVAGDAMALTAGERNSVADALLDRAAGVETGVTPRQGLRLMLAALAGKLSGAATTTVTIRDTTDAKSRIIATVDADGNRSAVTLDAS